MFKKILTVSLLMIQPTMASMGEDQQPIGPETKACYQLFDQAPHINDQIRSAPILAKQEGRELHIILGAGPFEEHMKALVARDIEREKEDKTSKAPIRVFFTLDSRSNPKDSTDRNPLFFGNFNSLSDWSKLVELLHPNFRGQLGAQKVTLFQGPVDKLYFDFSTVKHTTWDAMGMRRILLLLKPEGAIYIPEANLASQCVFAQSQISKEDYEDLKKHPSPENDLIINSYPYEVRLAPKNHENEFLQGIDMAVLEKRDGQFYRYNGKSLVYDTNFTPQNMSERAKKLVCPLKCELVPSVEGYPDIGAYDHPEVVGTGKPFLSIDHYIKVTKG